MKKIISWVLFSFGLLFVAGLFLRVKNYYDVGISPWGTEITSFFLGAIVVCFLGWWFLKKKKL